MCKRGPRGRFRTAQGPPQPGVDGGARFDRRVRLPSHRTQRVGTRRPAPASAGRGRRCRTRFCAGPGSGAKEKCHSCWCPCLLLCHSLDGAGGALLQDGLKGLEAERRPVRITNIRQGHTSYTLHAVRRQTTSARSLPDVMSTHPATDLGLGHHVPKSANVGGDCPGGVDDGVINAHTRTITRARSREAPSILERRAAASVGACKSKRAHALSQPDCSGSAHVVDNGRDTSRRVTPAYEQGPL